MMPRWRNDTNGNPLFNQYGVWRQPLPLLERGISRKE